MSAGVYADKAITGTKDTRAEFQRLISDCMDGNRIKNVKTALNGDKIRHFVLFFNIMHIFILQEKSSYNALIILKTCFLDSVSRADKTLIISVSIA